MAVRRNRNFCLIRH